MKKILPIILAMLLIAAGAYAEPAATPTPAPTQEDSAGAVYDLYDFEGGETMDVSAPYWVEFGGAFKVQMPAGWQNYALTDAQAENGMIACFGDGTYFLFVGFADNEEEYADLDELGMTLALNESNVSFINAAFNGTDFVCYADYANLSSNCATIIPGTGIYTFYFYPIGGDETFAQTVLGLMNSYTALPAVE